MICKNCGSELTEGLRFCDKCGAAIEETAPAEEVKTETAEEVLEPVAETEAPDAEETINLGEVLAAEPVAEEVIKPKKSRKGLKITAIILAVLVLLGGVAFLFRDKIEKILVGFASPERQLQYTYAKAAGNLAGTLFEGIDASYGSGDDVSGDMKMSLSLSDEFKTMLGVDNFVSANELIFDHKIEIDSPVTHIYGTLKMGDTELFGFDMYQNSETGEIVASFPGINDKFGSISDTSSGSMYEDYLFDEDFSDYDDYYGALLEDVSYSTAVSADSAPIFGGSDYYNDLFGEEVESSGSMMDYLSMLDMGNMEEMLVDMLPSGKQMKAIVSDVVEAALDVMSGVSKEKSEFTAGGVTESATCLKAEVTEKVVSEMAVAALKELKTNGKVKDYVYDITDELGKAMGLGIFMPDSDVIYGYYQDAMDELLSVLKLAKSDKLLFTLNTWIDSDYNILAIEFAMPGENEGSFFLGSAENGKETGFEFSARGYDGSVPLYIGGKTVENTTNIEFSRNETKLLNCEISGTDESGTMLVTFADEFSQLVPTDLGVKLSDYAIKLDITAESENDGYILLAIVDAKDTNKIHAGLSMDAKILGKVKVEMKEADIEDYEAWAMEFDFDEIISRFKAAGINEKLFEYIFVE